MCALQVHFYAVFNRFSHRLEHCFARFDRFLNLFQLIINTGVLELNYFAFETFIYGGHPQKKQFSNFLTQ